jgi:xanthine dehydrogenase small subunit
MVLVGARLRADEDPAYELHNSCLTTVAMVEGCHVITAEGLAGPEPGPVQRALLEGGAVQCGYCTPGLVVALTWALLSGTDPRRAALGNLCRCTGYAGIRRACAALAELGPVPPEDLIPAPVLAVAQALPPLAPQSVDLARHAWLAGATDEIVERRHLAAAHRQPTQLRRVPELTMIEAGPDGLRLGSAVTVAQVQASPLVAGRWPGLAEHLELFGSPAVRASATLGGNLVHASPTADMAIALLAMGASVVLAGPAGSRQVPLDEFFLGYHRTAMQPGELLTAVVVPDPPAGMQLHLEKVAKRAHDDIASVSLAMRSDVDGAGRLSGVRIAAGGVAPIPALLRRTAAALEGRPADAATGRRALAVLAGEVAPIDDVRGSAAYKRALLRHLLVAALDARAPGLAAQVLPPPSAGAGERPQEVRP